MNVGLNVLSEITKRHCWFVLLATLLAGCGEEKASGPIEVQIIKPTGRRCEYVVEYDRINTLDSLSEMRGRMGQVVTSSENVESRPEILDQGLGFQPVSVQFSGSGTRFSPLDSNSLFAASLYNSIEEGCELFTRLDPATDCRRLVPNMAATRIVHEARRTFADIGVQGEVHDNAEFLAHRQQNQLQGPVMNYFFSFPTEKVEHIPLGLNLGIMAHEFSHLISHYLFYEPAIQRNLQVSEDGRPTQNTLAALDEGIADYFGFLAAKDPAYFDCSYPQSGRDLSIAKSFTSQIQQSMLSEDSFDPHEGGAVFASINYEIGRAVGFEEHGKSILRLIRALATCTAGTGGAISADFNAISQCHLGVIDGSYRATAEQIYRAYLGPYGGVR